MPAIYSKEAEESLLSRLLADPGQLPTVADTLSSDDFHSKDMGEAFEAMGQLMREGRAVDIVAIRRIVGREIDIPLLGLTRGHTAAVAEYADIVRRDSFRRQVKAQLDRMQRQILTEEDPNELVGQLQSSLVALLGHAGDRTLLTTEQATDRYIQTLKERRKGMHQLSWGFPSLDDVLNPALSGQFIIVAARPSIGKTVLAEQFAESWASQSSLPILFASLEMSTDDLMDRDVARFAGIPVPNLVRGDLTDEQYDKAVKILNNRKDRKIIWLDRGFASTERVSSAAAQVSMMAGGLGGIIVDYLQILGDVGDQEVERVTRISRTLKGMARQFRCPVLVMSQLNRAVENRRDKHPQLHDLRESGSLEQDADVVLGLYRKDKKSKQLDLDILKQRQGPNERIYLDFSPSQVMFIDPRAEEDDPDDGGISW
jgi:replicative DNA helicase